jgi:SAM-dependent methyltransferase
VNNYEYCAAWVRENGTSRGTRVLDYGCGAGEIVALLRADGCDAYGCDVFYDGGDCSYSVPKDLLGTVIRRMDGDRIPFDDATFDVVVNNFVMEHVPDIDLVVGEICRVLKPGGVVLSLCPDRGTWREGHCGIPFLHWFPKGAAVRTYYAAFMSVLGFGDRRGRTPLTWSRETCAWLDDWTHYRTRAQIERAYRARFEALEHIEDHWLRTRLGDKARFVLFLPTQAQRFLVQRLRALAFVCRKPRAAVGVGGA